MSEVEQSAELVPLTGIFVTVGRDSKAMLLDISQLTDQEMETYARNNINAGWDLAKRLQRWIRENVEPQ